MVISIGGDHAGFDLKKQIISYLKNLNHSLNDVGSFSKDPCDYPNIAKLVCDQIIQKNATKGILICGTGIGMSICANRNAGIRAALCTDEIMVQKARLHNDANVLVLGARITDPKAALKFVEIFLITDFEGGRHAARLSKFS